MCCLLLRNTKILFTFTGLIKDPHNCLLLATINDLESKHQKHNIDLYALKFKKETECLILAIILMCFTIIISSIGATNPKIVPSLVDNQQLQYTEHILNDYAQACMYVIYSYIVIVIKN